MHVPQLLDLEKPVAPNVGRKNRNKDCPWAKRTGELIRAIWRFEHQDSSRLARLGILREPIVKAAGYSVERF